MRNTLIFLLLMASCGSVVESPVVAKGPPESPRSDATPKEKKEPRASEPQVREPLVARASPRDRPLIGKEISNGLRILSLQARPGELARITLVVEAGPGRDPVGKPGLALLTSRALLGSGAGGVQPWMLDETIDEIDAALEFRLDGSFAHLEGSCPPSHLEDLARTMLNIVTQEAPSRAVVRQAAGRLLRELRGSRAERIRRWQLMHSVGSPRPDPYRVEESLEKLGAADVALFHATYYRPQVALLAVQTAGEEKKTFKSMEKVFSDWKKGPALPPPKPETYVLPLAFAETAERQAEVIAMIPSPEPAWTGSGFGELVWQRLCMDGLGGLVQERLRAHGFHDVIPTVEHLSTGRTRIRALAVRVPHDRVGAALSALRESWSEAAITAPDRRQAHVARQRAVFAWDLALASPESRLRTFLAGYIAGSPPDLARRVLLSLRDPNPLEFPGYARANFRAAFLVRGSKQARPEGAALVPTPEESSDTKEPDPVIRQIDLDAEQRRALAAKALERALQAIGGSGRLQAMKSFSYSARCKFVASIPFVEDWTVIFPDGPIERVRYVLESRIRTTKSGERVSETADGKVREIQESEAGLFELESFLHPAVLLRSLIDRAKDTSLIGEMMEGTRKLLVLELELLPKRKLRLSIDRENGLLRRLEYEEWLPKSPAQVVVLLFRDYGPNSTSQNARGLRLPHTVYRFVEGEFRGESTLTY